MTTWNTVSIQGIKTAGIALEDLEDIYEPYLHEGDGVGGNHWDHGFTVDPDTSRLVTDEDHAYVNGRSKYRVDEIEAWIKVFTLDHPEVTITWDQEWDDDDFGRESTVWRKGELVREESQVSALVPLDYQAIIERGKAALTRLEATAEGDSNDAEIEAGQEVAEILRTLIEGIS